MLCKGESATGAHGQLGHVEMVALKSTDRDKDSLDNNTVVVSFPCLLCVLLNIVYCSQMNSHRHRPGQTMLLSVIPTSYHRATVWQELLWQLFQPIPVYFCG